MACEHSGEPCGDDLELLYVARYPRKKIEAPHYRCRACGTGWSWTRPLTLEGSDGS